MQLSILEVILFVLLIDIEQTSCVIETEKDNLLVYNYSSNRLLDPKHIEENCDNNEIIEDKKEKNNSETVEEKENDIDEIIENNEEIEVEVVEAEIKVEVIQEEKKPRPVAPVVMDVNVSLAENLVAYAKQFVGNPYVYGGNSLTEGTDCSGFTKLIYAQYGVNLPRVAPSQAYVGVEVPVSDIQIGDLVLSGYNGVTQHVAIYIGNGKIVHALNPDAGIVITNLYIMPITHVRRVL